MLKLSKNSLFVLSFLFVFTICNAQSAKEDHDLIFSTTAHTFHHHKIGFHLPENQSAFIKYNPVTLVFASAMYVYQTVFSPQIGASCMFEPSCSRFSNSLIKEFGIVKGVFLSADRLTRCNRISAADLHPLRINEETNKVHETTEMFKVKHENH